MLIKVTMILWSGKWKEIRINLVDKEYEIVNFYIHLSIVRNVFVDDLAALEGIFSIPTPVCVRIQ